MSKHKLTLSEREERIERRRTARERAAGKVELLREWHLARSAKAEKRQEKAKKKAANAHAKQLWEGKQPRGVDRVPGHLTAGNPLQRAPRPREVEVIVDETRQQYGDGTPGPRPTRQPRTPRRRFMPGAEARRIERNQKAWSA